MNCLVEGVLEYLFVIHLFPEIHFADNKFLIVFQLLPEIFGDVLQHQVKHRLAVLEVGDPRLILPGFGQETQLLPIGQKRLGEIDPEGIRGIYAFDGLYVDGFLHIRILPTGSHTS